MKKSLLALGATTLVAGLGLATSAQAAYYFGVGSTNPSASSEYGSVTTPALGTTATTTAIQPVIGVELNPGATGHGLLVPYYSAQGATATLLSIVNTDLTNGKAVKVRFRGAANSDDVLDFTVLLSPADVWTAQVAQGSDGLAHLSSSDASCTLPANTSFTDVPFITTRFTASSLSASQQAANTREGYVEIINMADIPPNTANGVANALYGAIKHTNGVAPCALKWGTPGYDTGLAGQTSTKDAVLALLDTNSITRVETLNGDDFLNAYGLSASTGQLTGSWALINQQTQAQFSGNDIAVRGYATASTGTTIGSNGYAGIAFSPQVAGDFAGENIWTVTADPLLVGGYATTDKLVPASYPAQWYDLPDVSTPLFDYPALTPTAQADAVANAIGKKTVSDEFWNDPNNASVPLSTDWIVSQPTRRYFAAVSYSSNPHDPQIVYNVNEVTASDGSGSNYGSGVSALRSAPANLPYAGAGTGTGSLTLKTGAYGPQACLNSAQWTGFDREENTAQTNAQFSPGYSTNYYCGEVATITWGNSPLSAALTNTQGGGSYTAGWAIFAPQDGTGKVPGASYGIPIIGFAALSGANLQSGRSIGETLPFRW